MEFVKIVTIILLLHICLQPSKAAQPWIKVGCWQYDSDGIPISEINAVLFTHLVYSGLSRPDSPSEKTTDSWENEQRLAKSTSSVKQSNPSVTTLLGILVEPEETFSALLTHSSYRKSFLDSCISFARLYGFQGLHFYGLSRYSKTDSDMTNIGKLFEDWRVAINEEARNSSREKLILTCTLPYLPHMPSDNASYPVDSIRDNFDWIILNNTEFHMPVKENFTGAHTALYDPSSEANTNSSIMAWIGRGLPASKIVLGLGFFGFSWTLLNQDNNGIGAPATCPGAPTTGPVIIGNRYDRRSGYPAIVSDGFISYKNIQDYLETYDLHVSYNATYVSKYFSDGSTWIGFDDAQTIKTKVSYAMDKNLLGYSVWQIAYDSNSVLSLAAAQKAPVQIATPPDVQAPKGAPPGPSKRRKWRLLLIVLVSTATLIFIVGFLLFLFWMRMHNSKAKISKSAHD